MHPQAHMPARHGRAVVRVGLLLALLISGTVLSLVLWQPFFGFQGDVDFGRYIRNTFPTGMTEHRALAIARDARTWTDLPALDHYNQYTVCASEQGWAGTRTALGPTAGAPETVTDCGFGPESLYSEFPSRPCSALVLRLDAPNVAGYYYAVLSFDCAHRLAGVFTGSDATTF